VPAITHKNGTEVDVQYFGDLDSKLAVAKGYVNGVNAYNQVMSEKDGIFRTMLDVDKAHKSITKAHNKFYGLDNKYDGKGDLKVTS